MDSLLFYSYAVHNIRCVRIKGRLFRDGSPYLDFVVDMFL